MEQQQNLIELFEQLPEVEVSEGWEKQLWMKIDQRPPNRGGQKSRMIVLGIAVLLITANALTLSKHLFVSRTQPRTGDLGNIASEFLISTSSSQY